MYQRILVPIDGSPTAERGLQEAISMARGSDARLLVLHVVDDYQMVVDMSSAASFQELLKSLRQYGLELLTKARHAVEAAGLHAETLMREVTASRVSQVIVDQAAQHHCDLIVMGTHGRRGFNRIAMGSAAEQVARTSPVPVLLVRSEDKP